MASNYRFSNLLGATYQGGNLQFTPDGNTLLSAVGNRVAAVDLVQGCCATLNPQNREDITVLALSPDARILLSIDLSGRALLTNFLRGTVLCRINFKAKVQAAKWSPDGAFLAVTHGPRLRLWRTPTLELGWQFVQHRTFGGHHEDVVDVTWSPDSLFLASCSRDMTVRLFSLNPMKGFEPMSLVEHRSHVRAVFFSADMSYLFSLSRDGVLVSLRYDLDGEPALEKGGAAEKKAGEAAASNLDSAPLYCRPGVWAVVGKAYCQQPAPQKVTRCAFDDASRLLAAGFSGGIFMLYEMPELQALQTLSLGSQPLDAVALGAKGDWLAVGSSAVGQLLVWEWRSETYVLKQQGHHWGVQCVAFSPAGAPSLRRQKTLSTVEGRPEDRGSSALAGRLLATGGYDGKVKLFNAQSGLCFVTFAEHTAPISALCFLPQGNAVVSASQDGSVRAFDLLRYRNFRTFASPDGLCQFASVAVDSGGEIVIASATGGKYAIYAWSLQTGTLLDVLTAHTSNVQSIKFSPSASNPGQVVSGGWDGTLRVWDLYGAKGAAETLQCSSSVLSVAFDPRANDICAAACLAGQVQFWHLAEGRQLGSIEGLRDIRSGRQWHDSFAALHSRGTAPGKGLKKKGKLNASDGLNLNQHFSSIAYARSGELLLCGSRNSPHLLLYDTASFTLALRLTLTSNRSLSGVQTFLNSNNMTETGVAWQQFDLSDSDADDNEVAKVQKRMRQATSLPGVHVGEAKDMYTERELHVWDVAFSTDSQQLAAATTHGLFVYSADMGLGTPNIASGGARGSESGRFVPQLLTKNVSISAVLLALEREDRTRAMILALALNDHELLRRVYQSVPVESIPFVIASIGSPLLPALLRFIGLELRPTGGTPHFQFHIHWMAAIVDLHCLTLLELTSGKQSTRTGASLDLAAASGANVSALCLQVLLELSQRHAGMVRTFDDNTYLLSFLGNAPDEAGTSLPASGGVDTKTLPSLGSGRTFDSEEQLERRLGVMKRRKGAEGVEAAIPPNLGDTVVSADSVEETDSAVRGEEASLKQRSKKRKKPRPPP